MQTDNRSEKMPPGIPFIVANEFAERFCFYGINAILSLYLTSYLHFGDAHANVWQSLFKMGAYCSPLIGAVVADVLWGKFRTIMVFSLLYSAGCAVVAFGAASTTTLAIGLGLVALGTGGIKPCVSTNVGDQFTSRNQHLIERAFSYFYFSINAGSSVSIWFCPILLKNGHPTLAFGMPALMMLVATLVFWLGRKRFVVVPPAGRQWLRDIGSAEGLRLIGRLSLIYLFVAVFWALWDQSNGQAWTLQATSDLMDKNLGFGFTLLAGQIQIVNGLLILAMIPLFTYGIYPLVNRFFKLTPLRKIGSGFFVAAASFLIVSWVEARIQSGQRVSVWWQILAYVVLSASEVLVSITCLEFSYKQAPLRMKSFIMALYLLSISVGNGMTASVNSLMVRDLPGTTVSAGVETWVTLPPGTAMIVGQKIDFTGKHGVSVVAPGVEPEPLEGTFLVSAIDGNRVRLMDNDHRQNISTSGTWHADGAADAVSTYKLVGPQYYNFFAALMGGFALLFILAAMAYRGADYVRTDSGASAHEPA
ncbi:MAG: POT family MFS transporter [Steroidobacteraceae bacterium]|jgi:proton-dependent oligopeptide transporter, POT family